MASTRQLSPIVEPLPRFLRPLTGTPDTVFHIVARTEDDAQPILPPICDAVANPQLTVLAVGTLEQTLASALSPARLRLAWSAGSPARPYSLRCLAPLGWSGARPGKSGRADADRAGCGGGLVASRVLSGMLYELPTTDTVSFDGAGALVLLIGLLAA